MVARVLRAPRPPDARAAPRAPHAAGATLRAAPRAAGAPHAARLAASERRALQQRYRRSQTNAPTIGRDRCRPGGQGLPAPRAQRGHCRHSPPSARSRAIRTPLHSRPPRCSRHSEERTGLPAARVRRPPPAAARMRRSSACASGGVSSITMTSESRRSVNDDASKKESGRHRGRPAHKQSMGGGSTGADFNVVEGFVRKSCDYVAGCERARVEDE